MGRKPPFCSSGGEDKRHDRWTFLYAYSAEYHTASLDKQAVIYRPSPSTATAWGTDNTVGVGIIGCWSPITTNKPKVVGTVGLASWGRGAVCLLPRKGWKTNTNFVEHLLCARLSAPDICLIQFKCCFLLWVRKLGLREGDTLQEMSSAGSHCLLVQAWSFAPSVLQSQHKCHAHNFTVLSAELFLRYPPIRSKTIRHSPSVKTLTGAAI